MNAVIVHNHLARVYIIQSYMCVHLHTVHVLYNTEQRIFKQYRVSATYQNCL